MKEKDFNLTGTKICPRCGKEYTESSALSRADNETLICPDCGTREALAAVGVDKMEQEKILSSIHGCMES